VRINKVYEILGNEDEVAMANNIGKLISELHFNKSEYFKGFEVDDNPYIDIAFFWRRFDNDGLTIVNEFINKYKGLFDDDFEIYPVSYDLIKKFGEDVGTHFCVFDFAFKTNTNMQPLYHRLRQEASTKRFDL